MNCHSAIQNQ